MLLNDLSPNKTLTVASGFYLCVRKKFHLLNLLTFLRTDFQISFFMILILQDIKSQIKIKTNKTRLNIQFRQMLAMDAALDI